ncbi:MAG: ATP synthase subunit I [Gammaproteobacteria bacterium]|nr:ATP synthase subunit I [Gammaproteobacteria bacterium]
MNKNIIQALIARLIVATFYVLYFIFVNAELVFSALVGVLACLVPEVYQGMKLSKSVPELEPSKWLRLAYQAMFGKWLMSIIILAIAFSSSVEWNYFILFSGYFLVNVSGLLAPILNKGK